MEFPKLETQCGQALACIKQFTKTCDQNVRFVISPLRICPVGAQIDHQGGPVLGMTVNAYSVLAFAPAETDEIRIRSINLSGETRFCINESNLADVPRWEKYAVGAAQVFQEFKPIRKGFFSVSIGVLIGSGLSSSASIGLAYPQALAAASTTGLKNADKRQRYWGEKSESTTQKFSLISPGTHLKSKHNIKSDFLM